MRLKANCRVDFGDEGDLFLMFHGYGNDEHEMIRIIDAVDAEATIIRSAVRMRGVTWVAITGIRTAATWSRAGTNAVWSATPSSR